jgi:hypothetical protein
VLVTGRWHQPPTQAPIVPSTVLGRGRPR